MRKLGSANVGITDGTIIGCGELSSDSKGVTGESPRERTRSFRRGQWSFRRGQWSLRRGSSSFRRGPRSFRRGARSFR